jgi:alkylation response protein AidB-like acyl-CoA dehydrogenase
MAELDSKQAQPPAGSAGPFRAPPASAAGTGAEFRRHARGVLSDVARQVGWVTRPAAGTGDDHNRGVRRTFDVELWRRGWAGLAVPAAYGGAGRTLAELAIFSEESAKLGLSTPFNRVALGIVLPALLLQATEAQKVRFIPKLLSCQDIWCQGFSETEAGSDLASLRTSAVLEAGQWIVSGSKVWTTLAHEADRCLLLVRTDNSGRKHEGITALMVEMKQPGVSVRPITQINGSRDFAEVTFTQATAPEDAVLGAVGNGWRVAMAALSYERSLHLLQRQLRLSQMAEELRRCVDWSAQPADCSSQMLDVSIAVRGLSSAVRQQLIVIDTGDQVGVEANASKVVWSETYQKLARLGLQLALRQAGPDLRSWTEEYYSSLATSIYAGTNEIQRTVVGERGLGLPR